MDIMNVLCAGMNRSISHIHIWVCNRVSSSKKEYTLLHVSGLIRKFITFPRLLVQKVTLIPWLEFEPVYVNITVLYVRFYATTIIFFIATISIFIIPNTIFLQTNGRYWKNPKIFLISNPFTTILLSFTLFTQPLHSGRIWHKVIFKRCLTGLNSEFSFS